jgi:hypothetical protein
VKKALKYIVLPVVALFIGLVLITACDKQDFISEYEEKTYTESQKYIDDTPESKREYIVDENLIIYKKYDFDQLREVYYENLDIHWIQEVLIMQVQILLQRKL